MYNDLHNKSHDMLKIDVGTESIIEYKSPKRIIIA